MIKILNKIRHKLISENKLKNYFLYGVGETLLVVIGILIAIQINNWNDQRIINKQVNKSIEALKVDVSKNIDANTYDINILKQRYDMLNSYLNILIYENCDSISDRSIIEMYSTIGELGGNNIIETSYEQLIYSDLIPKIKDDSLKIMIISFGQMLDFRKTFDGKMSKFSAYLIKYNLQNANLVHTIDSLNFDNIQNEKLLINRSAYVNNQEFINLIIATKGSISHLISLYEYEIKFFNSFKKKIENYLKKD